MSFANRLKAIERTIRPHHDGAEILLLKPDLYTRDDQPRAEMGGPKGNLLCVLYPPKAVNARGKLVVPLDSIIPDGPDHARFLRQARFARRTIILHYTSQWGAA